MIPLDFGGAGAGAEAATAEKTDCPPGMRFIAAGEISLGSAKGDPLRDFGDLGLRREVVGAYCVDRLEYGAGGGQLPLTGVSWARASGLCQKVGKRLCTEAEWERGCKGPGGRRFPYGDRFDPEACVTQDDEGEERPLAPGGSKAGCRSAFGLADMSGNAAEWTSTPFKAGVSDYAVKGGSGDQPDFAVRCASRKNMAPGASSARVGFRCCSAPL